MTERSNPIYLLTLWYKPGQTMQGLIERGGGHLPALVVATLFGFVQAIPVYLSGGTAGGEIFLIGASVGFFGVFFFSWLLRNFGRWFGAQATLREARTALGLSLLPWLLVFTSLFLFLSTLGAEVIAPYYWIFFLSFLYGYVIILLSLAAALRLSVLKTFLSLIVTIIVSLFPLTLLLQVVAPGILPAQ